MNTAAQLFAQIQQLMAQLAQMIGGQTAPIEVGIVYRPDGSWHFVAPEPDPEVDGRVAEGVFEAGEFTPGRVWQSSSWNGSYHKWIQVKANADAVVNGHRTMGFFVRALNETDEDDIALYIWHNRAIYGISNVQALDLLNRE